MPEEFCRSIRKRIGFSKSSSLWSATQTPFLNSQSLMISLVLTTRAAKSPVHLVMSSELQLGIVDWFENSIRKPKFDIKPWTRH